MGATKKCKHCQAEIDKKAKICQNCMKKQPINKLKLTIIIVVACLILRIFIGDDADQASTDTTANKPTVAVTKNPTASPAPTLSPKQSFVKSMKKKSKLKEKTVSDLYGLISRKLGFKEITFKGKKDIGDTVYDIIADDYKLMVIIDDDKLYSIKCGDYNLYEKNKVKYTKQDLLDRDLSDGSVYYSFAKEIVKNNLKSPRSAKFPSYTFSGDKIGMQRNGDYVAVQSYVDADNSFGANIRSEFLVEFKIIDMKNYSYQPIYINIDGTKSGKYKKLD